MRKILRPTFGHLFNKNWVLAATLICGASVLTSCSNDDNPPEPQEYSGVPLVILDTDIGSSTDDLFALEMLHRYEQEDRCRLLGVVVDRMGEANAAIADVMNTYFGHPDTPLGLVKQGIPEPKVWIDYGTLPTITDADGKPMFSHTVSDYASLPDGYMLYRRLLAAQPDHSVSICSIGFVTALAALLQSEGDEHSPLNGVELVRRKVKCIYLMGGVFGKSVEPDFNLSQGITFASDFFRLWPKEVDMVLASRGGGERRVQARTGHQRHLVDGCTPHQASLSEV